ncbi:uncharacterized protein Tco025E_04096 [Trypanosoma conorhini]|uniref:Uncharacterized protein n=1 Tax=Trypanosoma conorhini TaxID=83891 RepID=A0A3R7P944_9TRYP|nr:uncharacterized protein Tco025E_04096 [Trypanosoma conorhini]RNF19562.1 hypothetical protein Tco025E_04096 [Trypanosoma conorhini]
MHSFTTSHASLARSPTEDAVPSYVLYSPQGSKPLAGLHVEGGSIGRYYDKETRSQLIRASPSAHISFLRNTSSRAGGASSISSSSGGSGGGLSAASQRVVVLQICCEESARTVFSLTVELTLQDKLGRHRLVFSSTFQRLQRCAQHVKVPLRCFAAGVWTNIVLDVPQIHAALFSNSGGRLSTAELVKSRKLLSVTLSCSNVCRIRRVLGMPQLPPSHGDAAAAEWPLSLRLPPEVPVNFWVIRTCEEAFLQQGIPPQAPHHRLEAAASEPRDPPQCPVPGVPLHSSAAASDADVDAGASLDSSGGSGGGTRGVPAAAAVRRGRLAALPTKGCQTGERQLTRPSGTREAATLAGVTPRTTPTRDASVQTPTPPPLRVAGTGAFGVVRDSAARRPTKVADPSDMSRAFFDEAAADESRPALAGRGSNGRAATASTAAAEASPARCHGSPERREKTEAVDAPAAPPPDAALGDAWGTPPEAQAQAPSVANYAKTLDLMRERVKCIQALIRESANNHDDDDDDDDVCRADGYALSGDARCATGGGSSNHSRGGSSRTYSSGEVLRLLRCGGKAQPQQQQRQEVREEQQRGLCSSPRLATPQRQSVEELGGCTPVRHTQTPRGGLRSTAAAGVAHVCAANPSGEELRGGAADDEEDEEDEGFTVNVCMSEEHGRPAVVVPGDLSALCQKPPVPPSRPQPREVDRLCFDSLSSEKGLQELAPQWAFCGATPLAQSDSLALSEPSSLHNAGPTTPAAAVTPVEQAWPARARPQRGRLGEHAVGAFANMEALQTRATAASNSPRPSPLPCRSAEELESNISAADYRRPPITSAGGLGVSAANTGRFISVDSNCGGDEERNNEEEEARPPLRVLSLPPKSPSRPRPRQPQQELQQSASRGDPSTAFVFLPSPSSSGTRNGRGARRDGPREDVAVESGNASRSTVRPQSRASAPLGKPPENVDENPQPFEDGGGPLVFDPLLRCCLDLRSNTYVVATRPPRTGTA